LDYEIHSEGSNISEGQKSMIQLLRGVLLKPSLICMDEFNAELDNETGMYIIKFIEILILDLMLKKFPQITFMAIVHKLYILEKFDYIYVIENGEIVDKGTPSEMLKRSYISEIK
jgi:ABC-type bacteriocin/lantibiotic exporter with double-glycine peptidase domain